MNVFMSFISKFTSRNLHYNSNEQILGSIADNHYKQL